MAKIKKQELTNLTDNEIREFFSIENVDELIKFKAIHNYIIQGTDDNSIGNRINRIEKLLSIIIVERFLSNETIT